MSEKVEESSVFVGKDGIRRYKRPDGGVYIVSTDDHRPIEEFHKGLIKAAGKEIKRQIGAGERRPNE